MWEKIALTVAKIGLSLLAPNAGNAIKAIHTVAEVALPIVENVATLYGTEDEKWNKAVDLTRGCLVNTETPVPADNIIESGVQLAYSLIKDRIKK